MEGIYKNHTEFTASIVKKAWTNFLNAEVREVLNLSKYGKNDTLGLDSIPEIIYVDAITEYDSQAIFVTEETDEQTIAKLPATYNPNMQPLVFISDPTDRSKFLKKFIIALIKMEHKKECDDKMVKNIALESGITIRQLWNKYKICDEWEKICEAPADITGATTAVTCIYRGESICSAVGNYITGKMVLACGKGVFNIDLTANENKRIILDNICKPGKQLKFPYAIKGQYDTCIKPNNNNDCRRFVTFLGKAGYGDHFNASKIFLGNDGVEKYLHHKEPGGPSRPFYLSSLNSKQETIGFILSNGEKITEWSHWLPVVKFSKDMEGKKNLRIFEVYTDSSMAKNGIPMSVPPSLSMFRKHPLYGKFVDINKISQFDNPSHYRSMIVICHRKNTWLTGIMAQKGYRDIGEYI